MRLPSPFEQHQEWTLVGPLGPQTPTNLETHPVLAVDGGARFASRIDLWVGDGDSHPESVNCLHKFEFSPHKSQSDLALALALISS